jgi:hypothetical protein
VLQNHDVSVANVLADHRIATHPQRKGVSCRLESDRIDRNGNTIFRLLFAFPSKSSWDGSENGDAKDLPGSRLSPILQAQRTRLPWLVFKETFPNQRFDMAFRGPFSGPAEVRRNFPSGRRGLPVREFSLYKPENCSLNLREIIH